MDYIVLVLRKAVFNKEPTSRLVAVAGFVELIMLEESHSTPYARTSSDLCMQTFGLFRRCLTQQAIVRQRVYESCESMFISCPTARAAVAEVLHTLWHRYAEPVACVDSSLCVPLRLDLCIRHTSKGSILEEPLPALIKCIGSCGCHLVTMEDSSQRNLLRVVCDAVRATCKTLVSCEVGIFGLPVDKIIATSETDKTVITAILLRNVCEAFIEFSMMDSGTSDALDIAMKLYNNMHVQCSRLAQCSKTKPLGTKSNQSQPPKSRGALRQRTPSGIQLSVPCLTRSLKTLCAHKSSADEMPKLIRFRQFVYQSLSSSLSAPQQHSDVVDPQTNLAAVLVSAVQSHRDEALAQHSALPSQGGKKKQKLSPGQPATVLALQCLSLFMRRVAKATSSTASDVACTVKEVLVPCAAVLGNRHANSVSECFDAFQSLLEGLLNDESSKEAEILLQAMCTIAPYIEKAKLSGHVNWIESLANNQKTPSCGVSRAIVRLILKMCEGEDLMVRMGAISNDLQGALGAIPSDQYHDRTVSESQKYGSVIVQETAAAIAPILFEATELVLQEVYWALGKLKSTISCHQAQDEDCDKNVAAHADSGGRSAANLEAALYERMTSLVNVLEVLAATNFPRWALTEKTLRMVTKLFRHVKVATRLVNCTSAPFSGLSLCVLTFSCRVCSSCLRKHYRRSDLSVLCSSATRCSRAVLRCCCQCWSSISTATLL